MLLVGGGPQEQALKAQARRLGVEDKVVFTGRVPHGEVQRYYDLVDVLAYPRRSMRLTELVTPLKPLEAMAQGRLLVASDVGGHRELIRDGETGLLFRAGDAGSLTDALLQTAGAARSAGRSCVRRAAASSRASATGALRVARYRDVYRDLASQGGARDGLRGLRVGAGRPAAAAGRRHGEPDAAARRAARAAKASR